MDKTISDRIIIGLMTLYGLLAALSIFLPQDSFGAAMPANQMPAAPALVALANAGIVLIVYGGLGFVGLLLARKLALPEIWDSAGSNRGRFFIPALIGLGLGMVFIIADLIFSPINGIGRLNHPPFPTAIVASISAGIGEETMFRLFFISFWTWLVARLLLRGWIAGVLFAVGGFLFLAWMGRIVSPLLQNQTPALENTTTLVIQTMDLGLIVPLAILSGILLLRRSAWGCLLASVFVMKAITMGLAVSAMGINMALIGAPDSLAIVIPFLIITLINLVMAVLLLRNVDDTQSVLRPAI